MSKTFNKKRLALVSGLALAASLTSQIAVAEVTGEIGVTNDYRFRGVSQTANGIAVQGGIDYSHDSGFFVGAWASNVDFDEPDYDGPSAELDVYAGYYGEVNDDMSYDVTLYRYNYVGDSDLNYFEVTAGIDFSGFRVAYWYTNDYGGSDLALHYSEINYGWEFAENWSLDLHYGYSFGDSEVLDSNYSDYSIGVSTEIAGFGLSLAWLDNDISSDSWLYSGDDLFNTDSTVLASVTYAF